MKIQILGGGCANCEKLERNVREAALSLGIEAEYEKVKDYARIAEMGVMSTPAFAIDGVVKSKGRVLSVDQAAEILKAAIGAGG